jgi:hypothetical protein
MTAATSRPPAESYVSLLRKRELSGSVLLYESAVSARQLPHLYQRAVIRRPSIVRSLKVETILMKHTGCVNVCKWNRAGDKLISGSDDCCLNIWSYPVWQLTAKKSCLALRVCRVVIIYTSEFEEMPVFEW